MNCVYEETPILSSQDKTNRHRMMHLVLFLVIVFLFCFMTFFDKSGEYKSFTLKLSFGINIFISIVSLIKSTERYSYSFEVMFWIFGLVFFGIAPLFQFYMNWKPWELIATENEIFDVNIIILIWYIAFIIDRKMGDSYCGDACLTRKGIILSTKLINDTKLIILDGIGFVAFGILFYFYGFKGLIFRSVELSVNSSLSLLLHHGLRNILLYSFIITLLSYKLYKKHAGLTCIMAVLFLIGCFPTGLARYMLAAYYIGIIIISIPEKYTHSVYFTIFIFLGVTIVFPVANIFRYIVSFNSISFESIKAIFNDTYLTGNYDAHSMIISAFHYTEEFGHTAGRQALAAILFFVPRSIWPNKPIGSGALVIESLKQFWFTNVSMPLVGEAFLEFGLVGIILLGMLLGIITKKIDFSYWMHRTGFSKYKVVYPFALFYFFFMQRGDFMSSFAYSFANILIGCIACQFVRENQFSLDKHFIDYRNKI